MVPSEPADSSVRPFGANAKEHTKKSLWPFHFFRHTVSLTLQRRIIPPLQPDASVRPSEAIEMERIFDAFPLRTDQDLRGKL